MEQNYKKKLIFIKKKNYESKKSIDYELIEDF